MLKTRIGMWVGVLATLVCAVPSLAGGPCARCGCTHGVHKYCRLVCEEKEVKHVCYSSVAEDFCVPGRSIPCGEACDGCEHYTVWQPTCARVRTRHKLVKHEVVTRRPSWKWVVEELCGDCCHELAQEQLPVAVPQQVEPPVAATLPVSHQAAIPDGAAPRKRLLPEWLLRR